LGIGSNLWGMANPFDTKELLKYASEERIAKAIVMNSDAGRAMGVPDRPATKSELKEMHRQDSEAVDTHARAQAKHQAKADAARASGGIASKALAAFHDHEAKKHGEKLADAQSRLGEVKQELSNRFGVSMERTERREGAGITPPSSGSGRGAKLGHPFYGNQHQDG